MDAHESWTWELTPEDADAISDALGSSLSGDLDPLVIVTEGSGTGIVAAVRDFYHQEIGPRTEEEVVALADRLGLDLETYESMLFNGFRAPHYTVSRHGLVGTSPKVPRPRPGEYQLATDGLLLLDEVAELRRDSLESLLSEMRERPTNALVVGIQQRKGEFEGMDARVQQIADSLGARVVEVGEAVRTPLAAGEAKLPRFRKDDVIMPPGGRYPDDAFKVDAPRRGGFDAYPIGGGPLSKFRHDDVEQRDFRLVPPEEQVLLFRPGSFEIDGAEGVFQGWTDGQLWNGFATPRFDRDTALAVVEALAAPFEGTDWGYDEENDLVWARLEHHLPDERDEWPGADIMTPDGPEHIYPVGAFAWTWRELEPEEDEASSG